VVGLTGSLAGHGTAGFRDLGGRRAEASSLKASRVAVLSSDKGYLSEVRAGRLNPNHLLLS
jgi:hypothetical protein